MKKREKKTRPIVLVGAIIFIIIVVMMAAVLIVNAHVKRSSAESIIASQDACLVDADCILVLGAGVWNGSPSPMLADRLDYAIALYFSGASGKLLMSGDHGTKSYDEVNVMKDYALDAGVPSDDIFMDHAGFSTYESVYRAKEIFQVEKVIIVTQQYHLYRALYVADKLGLDAWGVASNPREYSGQTYRELREILARTKDWAYAIIRPEPTFLGDSIPISGNGNATKG